MNVVTKPTQPYPVYVSTLFQMLKDGETIKSEEQPSGPNTARLARLQHPPDTHQAPAFINA